MIARIQQSWREISLRLHRCSAWPGFYPLALLLLGLLTYLYAVPWLGYYWDDWEVVFLLDARDPGLLAGYFSFDRPFAWPYQAMYGLFGLQPIAWHLATLLVRWAGILLLYYSVLEFWPRGRALLQWAGALMLVYPGFLQQSISGAYLRHFTAFLIFALSVYLMVFAWRRAKPAWIPAILSWAAAFIHAFTIEYFVGLELLRPLLLWLLVTRGGGMRKGAAFRRTILLWLPYLLILGFYAWWRLIIFPATIPDANYAGDFKLLQDFEGGVLSGLMAVLTRAVLDLMYGTLQVWLSALGESGAWTFEGKVSWFAFGLAAVMSLTFAFLLRSHDDAEDEEQTTPRALLVVGLWAFVVSALPVWLTSKQLSTPGRWDDRFALAPMWGAVLLVIWLISVFIQARQRRLILAMLLGVSIVTQVLVANRYRLDWAVQNNYYWQLSWRVPSLAPGTAIISFEQPSGSIPGYDASFAMNLLFGGVPLDGSMPYWFFTNDRFMNFELQPGKTIIYRDRNLLFRGNTSEAIAIVHQGEQRCLQVLDTPYADQPFYVSNQEQLLAVSNVARISTDASAAPRQELFGAEPKRTWCYYFQKADLARQFGDWDVVLELEREARAQGFSAGFGPELLPFIEAHARQRDWNGALELSTKAQGIVSEMEPLLCSTWARLAQIPSADPAIVKAARQQFSCPSP